MIGAVLDLAVVGATGYALLGPVGAGFAVLVYIGWLRPWRVAARIT